MKTKEVEITGKAEDLFCSFMENLTFDISQEIDWEIIDKMKIADIFKEKEEVLIPEEKVAFLCSNYMQKKNKEKKDSDLRIKTMERILEDIIQYIIAVVILDHRL